MSGGCMCSIKQQEMSIILSLQNRIIMVLQFYGSLDNSPVNTLLSGPKTKTLTPPKELMPLLIIGSLAKLTNVIMS